MQMSRREGEGSYDLRHFGESLSFKRFLGNPASPPPYNWTDLDELLRKTVNVIDCGLTSHPNATLACTCTVQALII
jgi:hypothetical protein